MPYFSTFCANASVVKRRTKRVRKRGLKVFMVAG
jgi:hypothetical protein